MSAFWTPRTIAVLVLFVTTAPSPASAQAPPEGRLSADAPLLHGTLELSLADALRMGLENNLDVQVERYAPKIAGYDHEEAWGSYDPTAFAQIFYDDTETPNSFALSGVDESINRSTSGSGGFRGQLPALGTEYVAQFEGRRAKTNSGIQALSPEYTSGWSLELNQPLARDLLWNAPWTRVRSSRLLLRESQEGFRSAVMDEVQQIEDGYWELIAASESLRVANKSLEAASAVLDQTSTQFEVGVVSKVQVTEAEAGVSRRRVEQIRAENDYRNQQDVLIDLVLGPNLRGASSLEIRPTDAPNDFVPYEVDVEAAIERAFQRRPEFERALRQVERQEVELGLARNQVLPEVDAVLSFGQVGLSGEQSPGFDPCNFPNPPASCPNAPSVSQGGFTNSYDDYGSSPQLRVGARFSIPFPNTIARANQSKRKLELARARTQLKRLEQDIIISVRKAARNLVASQEGIVAARNAQIAAAEQLRAEEIRLEYGESTPFDVLQREEDLVERERDEIDAFQTYRTSVTALDRAQGTILRNRNIEIAEVAALR